MVPARTLKRLGLALACVVAFGACERSPAKPTAEQAAEAIIDGFRSGAFEIHFPKRFTCVLKLLSKLPYGLYFPLIRRITGGDHVS